MEGTERREKIINILHESDEPLSGTDLAKKLHVSRQVIVQDIALLRAVDKNILSTNKGYILFAPDTNKINRIFHVKHSDANMQDELNTIVDNGGKVLDVIVEHDTYGTITADLRITNRRDITEFMDKISKGKSRPLNILTGGEHYHTVEADSEDILDDIENELKKKGYLILE